jgi:putative spermidine/putrescine transport system ATP-binding protein
VSAYLSIDNVTVRYGTVEVLSGISLAVEAGTFVALLGSSGCGKTTLLRSISGFTVPSEGRIRLADRDITDTPPEKRNTAMVFQSYALWPHMSVFQNMAYGLKLRRQPRAEIAAKIDGLLTLLHLEGLADRNVTQLSGGQRQRVALGRALAIDPHVLLLDEPLSNLDARIRVELRSEIRAVQSRLGITAIHVTHDREEAMVLADRIVVLNNGRIEQEGTPEEVYHRPVSPFVASFMGADNIIRLAVRAEGGAYVEATFPKAAGASPARLPLGERGVHLVGISPDGNADAYFRAEAVRLSPAGGVTPAESISLPGTVEQVSYPGGVWRHTVRSDVDRFIIDDARKYLPGERVGIVLPADALHLFPTRN